MKKHLVFVYGTLKQGYGNNRLLQNADFIGDAVTVEKYRMLHGGFPIVLDDQQKFQIHGELYRVTDHQLRNCDSLEGYHGEGRHNMYDRKTIKVRTAHDEEGKAVEHECFIYIGAESWKRYPDRPEFTRTNPAGALNWSRGD